jgi:hypothetical protein
MDLVGHHRASKPRSNGAPPLSPVDQIIDRHNGSSTAIEATPRRLQASKQQPIPTLRERVVELERQNSNLKHEVAYYREQEQPRIDFFESVLRLSGDLNRALCTLSEIQQKVNRDHRGGA